MVVRLLDTNIVSFIFRRDPLVRRYARHLMGYQPTISFMTVGELFEGAIHRNWGQPRVTRLEALINSYPIYYPDYRLCRIWGDVRAVRRRQPIAVDDAWIAATALAYNLELVTHNPADFAGIPGLAVISEAP